MKRNGKRLLFLGILFVAAFVLWTLLVQIIDVQPLGQNETDIGFSTLNCWFHSLTGVHMTIYTITDWLGLIPLIICMLFGGIGIVQLAKRRSLLKVDYDILFLGIYYVIVILCYLIFEMFPVNYRPILIEGRMEASYPSSTTLLVLSVMPTFVFQSSRRLKKNMLQKIFFSFTVIFTVFMLIGRLVSGVHWFTDIVGSFMLSTGLFSIYKAVVLLYCKEEK